MKKNNLVKRPFFILHAFLKTSDLGNMFFNDPTVELLSILIFILLLSVAKVKVPSQYRKFKISFNSHYFTNFENSKFVK